jgi:cytoskeletal protein CcmA (bactofilin family)
MFRRKKDNEDDSHPLAPEPPQMTSEPRVAMRQSPSAPGQVVAPAMTPRAAQPAAASMPVAAAARPASAGMGLGAGPRPGGAADAETKKLIVGRDIMLSGKITSCDRLVVEGRVEADLSETRAIEISPNGIFKGTAEIDQAEIAGRFEGTITVRQRLFIRATGKVVGTIRYGTVEIEAGGEIAGDVQVSGARAE